MHKISTQSKSFIILFLIAIFGVFYSANLWSNLGGLPSGPKEIGYNENETMKFGNSTQAPQPVDTSTWKNFSDAKLGLSFKYKPDWKILPVISKGGYQVLQIDPGKKFYNIKIYVSPREYYVLEGLPTTNVQIGGQPGLDVNDLLFGVKNGENYYTFDIGLSLSLKNDFVAMVKSVEFR